MTYRFEELCNDNFEYCPYARAQQLEFEFPLRLIDIQTVDLKAPIEIIRAHNSDRLKAEIMAHPIEEWAAAETVAALFEVFRVLRDAEKIIGGDVRQVESYIAGLLSTHTTPQAFLDAYMQPPN